ncbi:HYR domain-containing protein [Archangium lansingense]|uniref:HYR domain-containing protein n=1 Tax=Archangium lansingense TaxID=2995310 RepID=A0ABT4A2X9_9BACT|nr:HYR domain-containing protein [Archangium lansinium]MCY1076005.1 HYR domain-containing protein [Archangium lansinium]
MRPSRFHVSRLLACLALVVPVLAGLPSHAASSSLLRDIRSGTDDTPGTIGPLTALGNTVYFASPSASTGSELWKSDGSPAGTVLVKEVMPGPEGSDPSPFGELNGSLFFTARGNTLGTELWKTDGTPSGTVRLLSVPNGEIPTDVPISEWARVGGTLFFPAQFSGDKELWKTDGTPEGTTRVKDIAPGDISSLPYSLTALGSSLYFSATTSGFAPRSLWKSDGTEAGTVEVWSPPSPAGVQRIHEVGGSLLVQVTSSAYPVSSLWKSDGTAAGTVKVVNLPEVRKSVVLGNRLVMWMDSGMWVTDGTEAGTRALHPVSHASWHPSVTVGSQLFFLGTDSSHGLELWTTDGTPEGTRLVKELRPGAVDGALLAMAALDGALYFMGTDTWGAVQLWKTDGTEAGTVKVMQLPAGEDTPSGLGMASAGGRLFFTYAGRPWVSDGTEAGTVRLVSSRPEPRGSNPSRMTRLGGLSLFTTFDEEQGQVLWRTDGTPAGTVRVRDLREGSTHLLVDPNVPWVVRAGAAFFMTLDLRPDGGLQRSLWRTDGTEAGTSRLKSFEAAVPEQWPLLLVGDTLFLTGKDAEHGMELWKTDGTAEGTVLVKDVNPGPGGSRLAQWAALGNRLFFWADDGTHGLELWTSDGTGSGTVLFKELAPGTASGLGEPEVGRPLMAMLDGTLYFGARDAEHGLEPWKTDGTPEGTVLLEDVNPGTEDSLSRMTVAGGRLYLSLYDGVHGLEPWVSDGTPAGTMLLADVNAGEGNGMPLGFTHVGGTVLFLARNPAHGTELWKTDGTPAGTALLSDVWPGPDSGLRAESGTGVLLPLWGTTAELPLWGVEELGLAFFQGADASSGQELWVTDGTAAGTRRVEDLVPGEGSSTPTNLVFLGDKLVFAAADLLVGNEPRVLPLAALQPDTTAPVLTCPASISATAPDANGVAVSYAPATATDDRDTAVIEYGQASGSTFPVGTTTVTVTATDTAGNRSSCTFEVTVKAEPGAPGPRAEGCACSSGGPGASAFWSLLALLAVACVRRRGALG